MTSNYNILKMTSDRNMWRLMMKKTTGMTLRTVRLMETSNRSQIMKPLPQILRKTVI